MEKCKYCDESDTIVVSNVSWACRSGLLRLAGWSRPGWSRPGWSRPGWSRPGWSRYSYEGNLCKYCEGTGEQKYQDCPTCDGTGYNFHQNQEADTCQECAGLGKIEIVHFAIRVAEPVILNSVDNHL